MRVPRLTARLLARALQAGALAVLLTAAGSQNLSAASQPSYRDPQFERLWQDATRPMGSKIVEYPDFTMVVWKDGLTYYYFTKKNHFAHPAIVKREATQRKDGSWSVTTNGMSPPTKRDDSDLRRWVHQFQALDRQMVDDLKRERGNAP